MTESNEYGFKKQLNISYEEAVPRATAALKEEGFGVLTEIDVKTTLKTKLDADFRKYIILGTCNPTLAHEALNTELDIGLLLPCNVIVYEDETGGSVVSAIDPIRALGIVDNPALKELADTVASKLKKVIDSL